MLISCPNCEAGYDVPDSVLAGDGRRLRCKACAEEWHACLPPAPQAEAPEPAIEPAIPAEATLPPEPQIIALPSRRARLPWLAPTAAWAASLVILLSGGAATFHWRADITAAWPPGERVFHLTPTHTP
jgi:predicted Zn finger-like uncharacterized protein